MADEKPVVFLDMDGVVNSAEWFARMRADALSRRPISHMIDPECVERLNRLISVLNADVVISSSWRIAYPIAAIDAALKERGFVGNIIGSTPKYLGDRGNEIQAWLTNEGRSAENIIILDDDSDMAHLTPCLIRTSWSVGLTDADCDRAIALASEGGE